MYTEIKLVIIIGDKKYYPVNIDGAYLLEEINNNVKFPSVRSSELNKIVALLAKLDYYIEIMPA